ncbi:hypothetical protein ID866_4375 [Astraeus odoratus]|nr:hypothetical protein ID866_4375 [Astraeus odoratus]
MQPVYDPENEQILQSFHNIGIYGDDDTDSAGSFTVQSSPVLHDATLSGSAVVIQDRRCKNETLVGTSQSCPSSGPHIVSCTLRRSASQTPRSGSTPPKHKPVKRPRPKMHECVVCRKQFPRPSGLATHMNSHSGERPFKCLVEGCDKSFAVRSNARRHLKTHGINPATYDTSPTTSYTVGFEQPVVNDVHDTGKQPSRYRWIPQSPAPHTNVWLCSSAPTGYFPLSLAASLSCSDDDNLDEDSCQQPAPDGDQW